MADEKKSVLGSITGTFKSELKNNVLDKLGPNLGSSIEKALEAKAQGNNFKDTFSSEYKSRLAESWKDKIFGQGIIGKSLRAGFEAKFGSNEKADPNEPVLGSTFNEFNDSLSESMDKEQGVLLRIETLATNISDNVFNITAAWSKNAKTLEETRKLQEDQHKLEMMAAEEASMETKSQIEPLGKPTLTDKENEKPGAGLSGITGMFSGLLKSAGKFKTALFGILKSKKFLALAALTIGTGAVAAALSGSEERPDLSENAPPPPVSSPNKPEPTYPPPSLVNPPNITEQDKEDTANETQKLLKLAKAKQEADQTKTSSEPTTPASTPVSKPSTTTTSNEQVTPVSKPSTAVTSTEQATPVSKPSTTVTNVLNNQQNLVSGDSEIQSLNEYFQKPENTADKIKVDELSQKEQVIEKAIKDTRNLASSASEPSEKARYDFVIKNQLEPSLKVITDQKQEIISRAKQSVKPQQQTQTTSESPTPSLVPPSSSPSISISGNLGSASGGGNEGAGPTMVENKPSTGSNITSGSEAVESAATSPNTPKIVNVDNSSSSSASNPNKVRRPIMSPVANRGSLDNMSFFRG